MSQSKESTTASVDSAALEQIQTLSGHPGHLTPKEKEALEQFRANLTEAKLYTPSHPGAKASHTDATLLLVIIYIIGDIRIRALCVICRRFLRARKFDLPKAAQQFKNAEEWRKTNDVDNLYRTFDVDGTWLMPRLGTF